MDKDRYFAVFESLRNAAFLLDHGGHLVNANQAAAELFLGRDAQAGDIIYLRSMRLRKRSLQTVVDKIMTQRNGHGFFVVSAFAVFFGVRQDASFNPVSPPPGSPLSPLGGAGGNRASDNYKLG